MAEELFVTLPSGCRICYQVFGNPTDPAIFFISGHSCAMTQKTDEVIGLLSPPDDPHFVVRYDHRDTGRSTSYARPPDDSPISSFHLVGASLGGPIAWQVAAQLSDRTRSLARVLTSPTGRQMNANDKLPPLNLEGQWLLGEAFSVPENLDDDEAWIQSYMSMDLALHTKSPTEAEKAEPRRESEVTYRRERERGTMFTKQNHSDASGPRWPRELLKQIRCPTVVVHAAKDQLFPMKHAEALRDDVEGATLVVLEDCGHEFPHRIRPQLADAILANVKKAEKTDAVKK
ncbi:alpha/beta-hydrolase [Xylaria sp. FL0064]|nr:alpha/beta-hydrolase [Xylaria sp. FL0064]